MEPERHAAPRKGVNPFIRKENMETSSVKRMPPVQASARKDVPAPPAPQGEPAPVANVAAAPLPPPRSALGDKLVRQMRQRDNPQQAAADAHTGLADARMQRAEKSIATMATLG
jgi:hypothetical protein